MPTPTPSETAAGACAGRSSRARVMLDEVPEVTAWFWIIKVLATAVGETFADFLDSSTPASALTRTHA